MLWVCRNREIWVTVQCEWEMLLNKDNDGCQSTPAEIMKGLTDRTYRGLQLMSRNESLHIFGAFQPSCRGIKYHWASHGYNSTTAVSAQVSVYTLKHSVYCVRLVVIYPFRFFQGPCSELEGPACQVGSSAPLPRCWQQIEGVVAVILTDPSWCWCPQDGVLQHLLQSRDRQQGRAVGALQSASLQ